MKKLIRLNLNWGGTYIWITKRSMILYIISKLEWNEDKFHIKFGELYMTPRLFENITNFNSPNDRKKTVRFMCSLLSRTGHYKKTIGLWI